MSWSDRLVHFVYARTHLQQYCMFRYIIAFDIPQHCLSCLQKGSSSDILNAAIQPPKKACPHPVANELADVILTHCQASHQTELQLDDGPLMPSSAG